MNAVAARGPSGHTWSVQGFEDKPRRKADEDLVRRLDLLSRAAAERVLERAFLIQAERHDVTSVTRQQLEQVASELGVDPAVVDRALREEMRSAPVAHEEVRWPWLGPARIADRVQVSGGEADVAEHVIEWMESEEGLRPVARIGDGIRWVPDTHWMTSTRLAIGSHATKALRGMPEVVHRQIALDDHRQVVELDVATGKIRTSAMVAGVSVAGLGTVAGGVIAAVIPGGNDLIQFLFGAVPGVVLGVGTAATTGRVWADSIRKGVARALDGIAHPELYRRGRRRRRRSSRRNEKPRSTFQSLVDEVSDALDRMFD
ncbi:hypothetical protein BH23ACT5_BH23ACT5_08530 [soil metagenome]